MNKEDKKDLPHGWVLPQLEELLLSLETGSRPKGGVRGIDKGIPSLGGEHVNDDGGFDFTNVRYVPEEFALKMNRGQIKLGDVLIVKDGATTGKTSYVDQTFPYKKAFVNEHVFICRASSELLSKYLFYFLWSRDGKKNILNNFKGSAQGGINTGFISNTQIPLPPLPEQQRIADKIEKLFTRSKKIKTNLDQVPKQLERLRKSILAAAVRGDLTKDWRFDSAHRPDYLEEPDYTNKNSIDNYNLRPNEIPDSWKWDYVRNLGEHILGKMLDAAKNKGEPTFYLRNINVRWFDFDLSNLLEIKATSEDKKKFDLRNGDVFICEGGEPGRAAVWSNGNSELIFQKAIHRIRLNNYVDPYWFVYNLKVDADNGVLSKFFTGTGIAHLTLKSLSSYQIPLPPLAEQKEIVRRVEKLLANVDKLEAAYKQHSQKLNTLNQSILAKAFRGELVPQDPNDEPASVLLERIKAEKGK